MSSHSPFFVSDLKPEELRVLYRDEHGYTQARRVVDMDRALAMYEAGGNLGHLWMQAYFDVGDPLVRAGGSVAPHAPLR